MTFLYVLKVWCEYCSQLVKGLWPFWVPFTRAIITKGKFECSTWWHSHTPCIWSFPILSLYKTLVLITQPISPFLPKGVFLEFPKKDFSVWKWLHPFILLCKDSNLWPTKYYWWQNKILFLLNGGGFRPFLLAYNDGLCRQFNITWPLILQIKVYIGWDRWGRKGAS